MVKHLLRRLSLHRLRRDGRGLAAIEFAIAAPMLLVLLIGVTDVGALVYNRMDTTSAIQTGAQYFMAGGGNEDEALKAVRRSWTSMPKNTELHASRICYCAKVVCSCTQNCADGSLPVAYHRIWAVTYYEGVLLRTQYVIAENVRVR